MVFKWFHGLVGSPFAVRLEPVFLDMPSLNKFTGTKNRVGPLVSIQESGNAEQPSSCYYKGSQPFLMPLFRASHPEGTKRAASVNVQLPCLRKDLRMGSISRDIEFSLRALQSQKWHVSGSRTFGAAWVACHLHSRRCSKDTCLSNPQRTGNPHGGSTRRILACEMSVQYMFRSILRCQGLRTGCTCARPNSVNFIM